MTRSQTLAAITITALAVGAAALVVLSSADAPASPAAAAWRTLAPGLDLGEFTLPLEPERGDPTAVILRIDPQRWRLAVHCATDEAGAGPRSARRWCEQEGLLAAINAGMFQQDWRTHVGYARCGDTVNQPRSNHYESVAAMDPIDPADPPFRIFDLDAAAATLEDVAARYRHVVQNLRLIKRPGENRWQPQEKRWSEAALGEDAAGRALFIFCDGAYAMHRLNQALLALPLDLVCAQHLDGGAAAQLVVRDGDQLREWIGTYESNASDRSPLKVAVPLPLVIGVSPRGE